MKKLVWLFLLIAGYVNAQQYPFLSWSAADGLAQSQVRSLYQDHLGYIWIGTLGGVSRFDGRNFDNFSKQNGLLNNQVNAITELHDSLLVFGSLGGISTFNGHEFKQFRLPLEQAGAQVNDLLANGEDELWVGTEQGLFLFSNATLQRVEQQQLADAHVKRILHKGDDLIIATRQAVLRWHGSSLDTLIRANDIGATVMDCIVSDSELLIATVGQGLLRFRLTNGAYVAAENTLATPNPNITGIIYAGGTNDDFWLKSRDGLIRLHNGQSTVYGEAQGLSPVDVRALLIDREQNLWIGTNGGGLKKFCGEAFSYYTQAQGLPGNTVMTILKTNDSTYWFGTYEHGIIRKINNSLTAFNLEQGIPNSRVWASLQTSDSLLWFGTAGGLTWFDGIRFSTLDADHELSGKQVYSLHETATGDLWCGTAKGAWIKKQGRKEFVPVLEIPEIKIRAIVSVKSQVWLASNEGVVSYENGKTRRWKETEGLPDNSVFCIAAGPENQLWIGTESGLCRMIDNTIELLPVEGGFGANHINFIQITPTGEVWIGTNDGLFHSLSYARPVWSRVGRHDGLLFLETNQNAVHLSDRELWFGTSEALGMVDLDVFKSRHGKGSPTVTIKEVRVNLELPKWSKYGVELKAYGQWPSNLILPYTDNHITFFFDALALSSPERIQYQYMLEGIDSDWEALSEVNYATYSNLDFDDYVFRVRAIDSDGETSTPVEFAFTIKPPFWLSWWFILCEITAVVLIVRFVYLKRKKAATEKLEKERLEYRSRLLSLEQQTLNSSMNRHFIFNALNSIQYYINRQDRLSANRYLSSFAKLIRKNLDSSQVNFTSLKEEIERLELYLELEHMRFKDKFTYSIHIDENIDQEGTKVPAMLLQPFLENSIWHGILPSERLGEIQVQIQQTSNDAITFRISDNGIGIETSKRSKAENNDHISQGMAITGGRIELLKKMTGKNVELRGPYELSDDQNAIIGTFVEIELPADFSSFETK
ncbi:MAG: hypothetical protein RL226_155 [Bacteroidota bacterium]